MLLLEVASPEVIERTSVQCSEVGTTLGNPGEEQMRRAYTTGAGKQPAGVRERDGTMGDSAVQKAALKSFLNAAKATYVTSWTHR